MDDAQFNRILEEKIEDMRRVLKSKAQEYAHGDRLSNFKRAAEFLQCTPEKALLGFVAKHIIALGDFVETLEKGFCMPAEMWAEKIGDIRNYMILMDALIEERARDARQ